MMRKKIQVLCRNFLSLNKQCLWLMLMFMFSGLVAGDKTTAISEKTVIEAVTVFRDRALVRRTFGRDFLPGLYTIKIANLPVELMDESVRVAGKGTAESRILDIHIKTERLEEVVSERIRELETKQRELEKQINTLSDHLTLLEKKSAFLDSLVSEKNAENDKENTLLKKGPNEWAGILSFIDSQVSKVQEEERRLNEEGRELTEKKATIDHELQQQQAMRSKEKKTIAVDLEIKQAGDLQLEASYMVPGASWTPYYDLRFASDSPKMGLTYQAMVLQNTGEDWENVALTLSTASAILAKEPPELRPFYLERGTPYFAISSSGFGQVILGTVVLPDDSPIPGVSLTLNGRRADTNTQETRTTISSEEGEFTFAGLPPGNYELKCELEGFKTVIRKGLRLNFGKNISIKTQMETSTLQEEVVVTAKANVIDTRKTTLGMTYSNQPLPSTAKVKKAEASEVTASISDVSSPAEMEVREMQADSAQVSAQDISATFSLKQKETILSNNTPQKVAIAILSLACEKEYTTVPRLNEQTYLKAITNNSSTYPLLAGKASMFYDEEFVATSSIPNVNAEEKCTVAVGEDNAIRIKRELVSKKTAEPGLLSRKIQQTYEYRITAQNFHHTDLALLVKDQIPVSEEKNIDIELLQISPEPQKPDEEKNEKKLGMLTWLLQLKPQEKKEIRFSIRVTRPRNSRIADFE